MSLLEVNGLKKGYGGSEVLHDISLSVEKGTVHGLIGENGSGKTTLLKCVAGIYEPDEGKVLLNGERIYEAPSVKVKLGYVADENEYFSGYRIVQMKEFYKSVYPGFSEEKYQDLIVRFSLRQNQKIHTLSKGQKMRLAFVLNMSVMPELLILDEPTAGLDPAANRELFECLIAEVEKRELTVLISSHHLADLEKICDAVTILQMGRVLYQDNVDDVKKKIRKYQAVFPKLNDGSIAALLERLRLQKGVLEAEAAGKVLTAAVEDEDNLLKRWFLSEGAEWVEEIELNLEEMFLYGSKQFLKHSCENK